MAKTFDGPPTLERSGSEHRRAVTSPLPEEEGLGEKVELSLQERRRGRKFSTVGRFSPSHPQGDRSYHTYIGIPQFLISVISCSSSSRRSAMS